MSLASEYAAREASAAANQTTVAESAPTPHECEYCQLYVNKDGSIRITVPSGQNTINAPAEDALMMADWINATFR